MWIFFDIFEREKTPIYRLNLSYNIQKSNWLQRIYVPIFLITYYSRTT